MGNSIIVQGFAILIDSKSHHVDLVNYEKTPVEVSSASITVRGMPGGDMKTISIRTPFSINGETIEPLDSQELDNGINQFHGQYPSVKYFEVKITLARTYQGTSTTQHAIFLGKFTNSGYEIDRYPIESGLG